MKNLYKSKFSRVHPTSFSSSIRNGLPEEVRELVAVLSPEEKDVVYYFLSVTADGAFSLRLRRSPDHSPEIGCSCFGCYKVFWDRWDRSVNRHIIHEILEKIEESSFNETGRRKSRKKRAKDRKKEKQDRMDQFGRIANEGDMAHISINNDNDYDDGWMVIDEGEISAISRFVRFIKGGLGRIW